MKVCHILGVEFEYEIDQESGLFLRLVLLVLDAQIYFARKPYQPIHTSRRTVIISWRLGAMIGGLIFWLFCSITGAIMAATTAAIGEGME